MARTLALKGWSDVEAIVNADAKQLAKLIGAINAAKLIQAAEKELGILISGTPSEQIAAAKGSKATK